MYTYKFLNIDNKQIAYQEFGENNKQTIICLHGLSRNSKDFYVLAKELSKTYRVICPDVIGRGKSDYLDNKDEYGYPKYISDLKEIIAQLNLTDIILIGTSMGGIMSMMLYASQSNLIKKIIINDIGSLVLMSGLTKILNYLDKSPTEFETKESALAYVKNTFRHFGINTDLEWDLFFDASFYFKDNKFCLDYDKNIYTPLRKMIEKNNVHDIDLSAFWNKINCPVLLLRGTISNVLSKETAESMAKKPNVTLVEFANVGHAPALLSKEQTDIIVNWLN